MIVSTMKKPKIHLIRHLEIYKPIASEGNQTTAQALHDHFEIAEYYHFPIVLNPDHSQWDHGCRYLFNLIECSDYDLPKSQTLHSIAKDLRDFKYFCLEEDIDYTKATSKLRSPTRRYRSYLQHRYETKLISANTLKRRMSNITSFYKWLMEIEGIKFKFLLWEEKEISFSYKDHQGLPHTTHVVQKDVAALKEAKNNDLYDGMIQDGGKLRPLSIIEQQAVFKVLHDLKNTEMTLAFLIAVTTGARIQTVFTLRCHHFELVLSETETAIIIPIGNGTNCDSKYGKRYQLYIPSWVYKKVQIYIQSERYKRRQNSSAHLFEHPGDNYIFLTKSKKPYYIAQNDPVGKILRTPIDGGAVRVFIKNTLIPALKVNGHNFILQFHDLRATFGMNLVSFYEPQINNGTCKYLEVLDLVSKRMGHSSKETTEGYLKYKNRNKLTIKAQDGWEDYCHQLLIDTI